MALVGAVEGLADLGGTGGGVGGNPVVADGVGGKGLLKLDVFLLIPEHEDVGLWLLDRPLMINSIRSVLR